MRAHIVERGGRIIDVTITELFANGCIVETPEDLQPDENVQLSILGSAAEQACVASSKDGLAELRFERSDSAGSTRQARPVLRGCRWLAKFHFRRASQSLLPTSRCSTRRTWGAAASISISVHWIGERLWVKFDGVDWLEAEVCWIAGPKVGLSFARPIHPAVFNLMVKRLPRRRTTVNGSPFAGRRASLVRSRPPLLCSLSSMLRPNSFR